MIISSYSSIPAIDFIEPEKPPSKYSIADITLIIVKIFALIVLLPATLIAITIVGPDRLWKWIVGENNEGVNIDLERFIVDPENLEINPEKTISLEDLWEPFTQPDIPYVIAFWEKWDDADFTNLALKRSLRNKLPGICTSGTSHDKVRQYIVILFNLFSCYREIVRQEGDQPAALSAYRRRFVETMEEVLASFEAGCDQQQHSSLPAIIAEAMGAHPDLISKTGASSPLDFLFALTLHNYKTHLIREEIAKASERDYRGVLREGLQYCIQGRERLFKGLGLQEVAVRLEVDSADLEKFGIDAIVNQIGFEESVHRIGEEWLQDSGEKLLEQIRSENVELECVVKQNLGLIKRQFQTNYFNDDPIIDRVVEAFRENYQPMKFFLEGLVEQIPCDILRKFHTDIASWYRSQGLDPEENRELLMNSSAGDWVIWFNEKAILYFMVKNQFLITEHEALKRGVPRPLEVGERLGVFG